MEAPALDRRAARPESVSYHRAQRIVSLMGYLADLAALIALLISGWSVTMRSSAEDISSRPVVALLIYVLTLGALLKVLSLPFDYLGGFWLEHRHGLSNLTIGAWIKDEIKGTLVGGALAIFALEFLYWTLRTWHQVWWLITGAVFSTFFILMANLAPVLILPVFFRQTPLSNPALEARLRRLAERAGTRVQGVFEWKLGEKTRKANAALTGLGNTRRILLSDTLLAAFSEEEVEAVLAHEFGHHVHADIWRGLAARTAATFLGLFGVSVALERWSGALGFRDASDFANLPLLALVALMVSLLLLPVVNGLARRMERAADSYAVRSIADSSALASSLERLATLNLAERRPHSWIEFIFHSHPSIEKRLELIRKSGPVSVDSR